MVEVVHVIEIIRKRLNGGELSDIHDYIMVFGAKRAVGAPTPHTAPGCSVGQNMEQHALLLRNLTNT